MGHPFGYYMHCLRVFQCQYRADKSARIVVVVVIDVTFPFGEPGRVSLGRCGEVGEDWLLHK